MSEYGNAWINYYRAVSQLGAEMLFPNPDVSPNKTFITSGEWKRWSKPLKKKTTKSKKSLKRKSQMGLRRQEEDEALRGGLGGLYGEMMERFR